MLSAAAVVLSVNAKWEVKEVPDLQPGTNQVLIKIHASGMCYTDVHITKGGLGVKFPHTILFVCYGGRSQG